MKRLFLALALTIMWSGCYQEFADGSDEPDPTDEVCDDDLDNDGDGLVDSRDPDCNEDAGTDAEEDSDADEDTDETVPEICDNDLDDDGDTLVDCRDMDDCCGDASCADRDYCPEPKQDAETDADAEEDTVEDTCEDVPEDTASDADTDSAPDVTEDTSEDVPTDDAPTGPPPAVGWLDADFRDWVSSPGDAVESRLYEMPRQSLTSATIATLPGMPTALCAFGSWNEWSYDSGRVCMTWSPSFTPGRPFYTRGGDTGYFFVYGTSYYEIDLNRFEPLDMAPCHRAATTVDGVTRLVLRCPALPELDICTNGADDDHDGLVDEEDADCDTFWAPPPEPDTTHRLAGSAIGSCVNFSGSFWFDTRDGYGLERGLNEGEYVNRITSYHDAMSGCSSSPCFSIAYPGDGIPVSFTICGFSWMQPAVTTSWGATLKMDVTALNLSGDLCATAGNTAITAWGLGTCYGGGPPAPTGTEVCDGADNDGDGSIDEGFACVIGVAESCTTPCGSTGTRSCSSSCVWGACQVPSETCNGRDDDCDGTVDEYCSGGSRFEVIGRDYGTYREIEVVATLNADHSRLTDNPLPLDSDEDMGSICVVYGSERWEDQIMDPYAYRSDPAPCQIYDGDGRSTYLYIPSGVDEFMLYAIGTRGSPRHRVWFWSGGWTTDRVYVTSSNIFSFIPPTP